MGLLLGECVPIQRLYACMLHNMHETALEHSCKTNLRILTCFFCAHRWMQIIMLIVILNTYRLTIASTIYFYAYTVILFTRVFLSAHAGVCVCHSRLCDFANVLILLISVVLAYKSVSLSIT